MPLVPARRDVVARGRSGQGSARHAIVVAAGRTRLPRCSAGASLKWQVVEALVPAPGEGTPAIWRGFVVASTCGAGKRRCRAPRPDALGLEPPAARDPPVGLRCAMCSQRGHRGPRRARRGEQPSTGHERTGPCRPRAAPTGRSRPGAGHRAPRSARGRRKAVGPKRPLRGASQASSRIRTRTTMDFDTNAVLVRIRRKSVHPDGFHVDSHGRNRPRP